jgi:L-2-hydroxycarboxylate dehydrogenase (NAD+)
VRVSADAERRLIYDALVQQGVTEPAAAVQAEWLVEADLRGHPSHGVQRLPVLIERTRRGLANGSADPDLRWTREASLVVDGDRGLGPWVASLALSALIARVATTGVAAAAIRNANHLGLLSLYVERAAQQEVVCLTLTTSEALVHPWGGVEPLVGTNPIAVGVPARPQPLVFDMATSEISMGKVLDHRRRGADLSEGWAIDAAGRPTTDPARVAALTPFGGAKGYALGLSLGVLVALLTSTPMGTDVAGTLDTEYHPTKGDLLVCFSPDCFGATGTAAVAAYLEELRTSTPSPDATAVRVPGDGARQRRTRALREGIELPDSLVSELERIAGPIEALA